MIMVALGLVGCAIDHGSDGQASGKGDGKASVIDHRFDMFVQVNMTSFQDTSLNFKIFSDKGRLIGVAAKVPAEPTDPSVVVIDTDGKDCRLLATSRNDDDVRSDEVLLWFLTNTGSEDGLNQCKFEITQPSGAQATLEVFRNNPT